MTQIFDKKAADFQLSLLWGCDSSECEHVADSFILKVHKLANLFASEAPNALSEAYVSYLPVKISQNCLAPLKTTQGSFR